MRNDAEKGILRYDLRGLAYRYPGMPDETFALSGVSFSIRAGEMVAMLGANGSGKSTLLNLLAGLIFPSGGQIFFNGKILSEESLRLDEFEKEFRRKVGIVFQNPDLQLFNRTVFEEILFGPVNLGLDLQHAETLAEKVVKDLRLGMIRDRAPHSLSGGEKKRVAIASVLVSDPEVILLDEPTGGLDPKNSGEITDLVIELARAGKTVISATNDMIAAPEIAERAIVLGENHTVIRSAGIEDVIGDESILVAANLIHAHKHRHGADLHRHIHSHLKDGHHEHHE